jgi:hypothetical protein
MNTTCRSSTCDKMHPLSAQTRYAILRGLLDHHHPVPSFSRSWARLPTTHPFLARTRDGGVCCPPPPPSQHPPTIHRSNARRTPPPPLLTRTQDEGALVPTTITTRLTPPPFHRLRTMKRYFCASPPIHHPLSLGREGSFAHYHPSLSLKSNTLPFRHDEQQ